MEKSFYRFERGQVVEVDLFGEGVWSRRIISRRSQIVDRGRRSVPIYYLEQETFNVYGEGEMRAVIERPDVPGREE